MGRDTGIGWCDSTVNCISGCDGCELWHVVRKGPCYAGHLHETRLAHAMPHLYAASFTEVRLIPGRMAKAAAWSDLTGTDRPDKPWLNGLPRVIFVEDMGDLFSTAVPFEFIRDEVIEVVRSVKGSRHIWMLLTKQPTRMFGFVDWMTDGQGIEWPPNVWPGTSVTSEKTVRRVQTLKTVPALTRFISLEPQLEAVDLAPVLDSRIHLVIQGGESDQGDHHARPFHLDWARRALEQARAVNAAFYLKQLGSCATDERNGIAGKSLRVPSEATGLISRRLTDTHGEDWNQWPADLRIREFPGVPR